MECGVRISSLEHFFLSLCFWQFFFSFARKAFLSSETNCSRFVVSFVSRKRKKFLLLSFEDHQFGCFQTKIKSSDECAKRKAVAYHRLIDFALFVCVCARESERAACARPDTTFLKWKKMYGKEIGSERATKRPKKYVSFSLSRNEEEKDDDFRSERE